MTENHGHLGGHRSLGPVGRDGGRQGRPSHVPALHQPALTLILPRPLQAPTGQLPQEIIIRQVEPHRRH